MGYQDINVVAFDADDTLWVNEPVFQDVEQALVEMLSHYVPLSQARDQLFDTNIRNLELFGYGAKSFTLSMIETAIEISEGKISASEIQKIMNLGKNLIQYPIELLDGVENVLQKLQGRFQLMLLTKGDLYDQECKIARSGLADYFDHVEIIAEKDECAYQKVLGKYRVTAEEFLMVGNSVKSDVLPVMSIGGRAIHVPFHTTWQHEEVCPSKFESTSVHQIDNVSELLPMLLPELY